MKWLTRLNRQRFFFFFYAKWTFPQALKKVNMMSQLCCDIRQPSRMDGLERVELTENRHGDASWSPRRRRLSAQRRNTGGRGQQRQLASVNTERACIVKIYHYRCCCCCCWKRGGRRSPILFLQHLPLASGHVVQFLIAEEHRKTRIVVKGPGLRDRIVWNKERKGHGVGTRLSTEQFTM